jgi:hypothetical protein
MEISTPIGATTIENHAIAIYSKITTHQSFLILVADLPSSTFEPELIIHPNEQTSLTNIRTTNGPNLYP